MTIPHLLPTVVACALVALLAPPASPGPPTDQLRVHVDRVLKVLDDPDLRKDARTQERRATIRKIANDIFDFAEICRRSLGRHWQARTQAEQEEFVQLLTDLLERTYISRIERYSGEKVAFLGDVLDTEVATVRTKIVTRNGSEIPIDYRMLRRGDRWLAYDVSVEGISLVANYRTQFNAVIQKASYQELVKKLREKQEEARPPAGRRREEPAAATEARPARVPGTQQSP
jgi:phospholipid transport system substrate-binding protein